MTELMCACGTFAVGRCAQCNDTVCADHSGLVEGRRLCDSDRSVILAEASQRAAREAEETYQRNVRATEVASRQAMERMRPFAAALSDHRVKLMRCGRTKGWVVREFESGWGYGDYGESEVLALVLTRDGELFTAALRGPERKRKYEIVAPWPHGLSETDARYAATKYGISNIEFGRLCMH